MELVRIGDKVIDKDKIARTVSRVLQLRAEGQSQAEAASSLGLDRTFISRLETVGEVRKGTKIALIGFPLSNCDEIERLAEDMGLDYVWLMDDRQRWSYVRNKDGITLLNDLMKIIADLKDYDALIMVGSDMRVRVAEALMGNRVYGIVLGKSPIIGDRRLDPDKLRELVSSIKD
ncbi:MAG TPA: transcriptional regulator [Bacillota bacterium]|nr:transcriptional regulator [Bacillota bacterium]HOA15298.1 transcriptional regulator [Bacillota bacterium]HOG53270.1 transcriptional regulator [Bacillota bacterium]